MPSGTTLIVGFGNVLCGDDGFGVEVLQRLARTTLPPYIETLEVGIGGMHFVLRLLDGCAAVVVVDAMRGGQAPGTLYVLTPCVGHLGSHAGEPIDPHLAEPMRALHLAQALGCLPGKVTVVGCEPACCDLGMGLTAVVHAAVDRAVETICQMVVDDGDGG